MQGREVGKADKAGSAGRDDQAFAANAQCRHGLPGSLAAIEPVITDDAGFRHREVDQAPPPKRTGEKRCRRLGQQGGHGWRAPAAQGGEGFGQGGNSGGRGQRLTGETIALRLKT